MVRELDREIEQRLVRHEAARLDAARGGEHELRLRVVDARGKLGRGEAAEHDGMDGAQPRAGEHRHHRFRHHRHVDEDAVAFPDTGRRERAGKKRHLVAQLAIGEGRFRVGDGAVVDERRLLGAAALDMAVEGIPAGVHAPAAEPAVKRRIGGVEHLVPTALPVDRLGRVAPESLGIGERAAPSFLVASGHGASIVIARRATQSPWQEGGRE